MYLFIYLFIYLPHIINYTITITKDTKMQKVMARRPKGNYKAYVNQASSITIFQDGIKITATDTNYYQKEIKVTISIKEVYKC